ncbi:hypothetical protein NQ315_017312 [Exocentrus adspersus]|uniref:SCP domain-containing protein n=1 Tax=Exocentrus adspersus TaxID=1586481 RepID=A0AAV8VKD4_9CUCU|nr:hypothetical protein NQ315_017312 [Exocentrus adspersus]
MKMLITISILFFASASAVDYCKLCDNGAHTMCQFKEIPALNCIDHTKLALTPVEKRYILDIHNDIRNHVASGQETKGVLGNQPPAADMLLLEWDEELAEIAQRWADQCISVNATVQHDRCRKTERFEVGQNIVTAITTDKELPELSVLILNWYKQVMYVVPSDVDEFLGIWRGRYLIGQYTQLVWAKTRYVGCAAAAFKENIEDKLYDVRLVCNYGPGGNIAGQAVYQRGQPCSKCPQKVCDRTRSNLCAGVKKGVNVKKHKNVLLKAYKDKLSSQATTPSVSEDASTDVPKLLDLDLLNTSNILGMNDNTSIVAFNNFDYTKTESGWELNASTSASVYATAVLNATIGSNSMSLSSRNGITSFKHKYHETTTKEETESSFTLGTVPENYENVSVAGTKLLFNLTSKFALVSSIQLLINNFFDQNILHGHGTAETTGPTSIIDLTDDECENEILLDGVRIRQDCDRNTIHSAFPKNQKQQVVKTVLVEGNHITLPGNRHFQRIKGIWHKGHCRCVQAIRSTCASYSRTNDELGRVDEIYGRSSKRYVRRYNSPKDGDDCVCLFNVDQD